MNGNRPLIRIGPQQNNKDHTINFLLQPNLRVPQGNNVSRLLRKRFEPVQNQNRLNIVNLVNFVDEDAFFIH